MKLDKLSAAAEIVSSIAILLTLVYLAIEIRQNSDAVRAGAREGVLQGELQFVALSVNDPEITLLQFKPQDELTELEASKLHSYLLMFTRLREGNYEQFQAGVLDEEAWENLRTSLTDGPLANPNGRAWWLNAGQFWFNRRFTEEINQALRDGPTVSTPETSGMRSLFLPASANQIE